MTLFEPMTDRKSALWQPAWVGIWGAITAIGLCLHPDPSGHGTHQELGLPPCPSALLFDRPCPGCGLTTSWTALLHGQWKFAFQAHPLGPVLYAGFTISAILAAFAFFSKRKLVLNSIPMSRFLGTCAMIFFLFGMFRMATTPHFRTLKESEMVGLQASTPR